MIANFPHCFATAYKHDKVHLELLSIWNPTDSYHPGQQDVANQYTMLAAGATYRQGAAGGTSIEMVFYCN